MSNRTFQWIAALLLGAASAAAQIPAPVQPQEPRTVAPLSGKEAAPAAAAPAAKPKRDPSYLLGPDDEISILCLEVEEISNKPVRIDGNGNISMPLIGRIQASGLTVERLEAEVKKRLKTFVREPEVTVSIAAFRSQPVSVIGAVGQPGVHQLEGRKTLIEILAKAGGLRNDAGYMVKVTRRDDQGPIPLPTAKRDADGFSVAEINVRAITDAKNPKENIIIMPNDVVSVPRADIVYVIGDVKRAGGFVLEREKVSVIQALAMANGLEPTASPHNAKIIRSTAGENRTEIPVNLKEILAGRKPDVPLQPEDILFVPNSYAKSAWRRSLDTAVQALTGVVIYRGFY
jgi:polysaccharide export outer membrane protein